MYFEIDCSFHREISLGLLKGGFWCTSYGLPEDRSTQLESAKFNEGGTGSLDDGTACGFLFTLIDGQVSGGGGTDKVRIKIWNLATPGVIFYDHRLGVSDDNDTADPQPLGGGSVVIHN